MFFQGMDPLASVYHAPVSGTTKDSAGFQDQLFGLLSADKMIAFRILTWVEVHNRALLFPSVLGFNFEVIQT